MNSFILTVCSDVAKFDGFNGNELVMITSDLNQVTFNTRTYIDNNSKKHRVILNNGICNDKAIIDILIKCHYNEHPTLFKELAGNYLPM